MILLFKLGLVWFLVFKIDNVFLKYYPLFVNYDVFLIYKSSKPLRLKPPAGSS